jgi:excinuclease ABC subunit C
VFDIHEELKKLPLKPGVYLMKDASEHIIYVGKAIRLKQRVSQYFRASTNHSIKISQLVKHIKSFEYIVTDSELEALILECNLIKEHRPKYNTMLKDDKMYPYIKVTVYEQFPRVIYTRKMNKDGSKYFGPYTDAFAAKNSIEMIRKVWGLRSCSRVLPRDEGKERPCLYYHIKQCDGPCQGYITTEDYHEKVNQVLAFLSGKNEEVIVLLEEKMNEASERLDFEKAAEYRDHLSSVKVIAQKQKVIHANMEEQDIIAFARRDDEALVQVFFVRNGKMMGREQYRLSNVEDDSRGDVMTAFVKQFYSGTPYIPKELILQDEMSEAHIIGQWLSNKRGQKVYIKVPQKGEKNKLIELAAKNASLTLEQFGKQIKEKESKTKDALKEIVDLLGVDDYISRVEAYDISNTSGVQSVGSMIVIAEAVPKRSEYRKFRIRTVEGPNDYASLEEVLTRRFTHALEEQKEILIKGLDPSVGKFTKLPDLILMDGGKGQVNIALKVLKDIGLEIPVCGMVKDDKHNTRGLYHNNVELPISKHSEGFRLITRVQDEAHRFAIEYHKKLRGNAQIKSVLDDIEGIGPARRKALMMHFKSIDLIKSATTEVLEEVVPKNIAIKIYNYFHKE